MPSEPRLCAAPPASRIQPLLAGASFHDAWCIQAGEAGLSPLAQFFKAARATPRWVDACMRLRNRVGALVGLKDLGAMAQIDATKPERDYRPGDRVGIFTLIENHPDELLMGDRDKHLEVVLSLHRAELAPGEVLLTLTTVVHVHNGLGRLYMLPVAPMHRLIAPAVMRAVGRG